MKKTVLKIIITITALAITVLTLTILNQKQKKKIDVSITTNNTTENQVISNEISELLSLEESDKNIIGYITIESINLQNAPIADGTDNITIAKYIGHFENSSYLDGNVCLCSHNRGNKAKYFEHLKNINIGDKITYKTKYETKEYAVTEINEIEETDLSVLEQTEENKITLITCIQDKKNLRLCVIGQEI